MPPALPRPSFSSSRLAAAIFLSLSISAIYFALRTAQADWLSRDRTPQSINRAIHLLPDNSLYYRLKAEIQPPEAVTALRQAVNLNPQNPGIHVELGNALEQKGHLKEAEAQFQQAVQLDHGFPSHWMLSDFYFRHHDTNKFWPAVHNALEHQNNEQTTLFENCWALSTDANLILEKAIPDKPDVLRGYLDFLLSHNHPDGAPAVANRIMQFNEGPEATNPLLNYTDQLIFANNPSPAIEVWNWLATRKFISYSPLDPTKAQSLTNGDFKIPPISRGFDWRLTPPDGIYLEYNEKQGAINLTFTGKQPEKCEILSEYLPLQPNQTYNLRVHYQTSDIAKESGLSWHLLTSNNTTDLLNSTAQMPGAPSSTSEEQQTNATFSTPPQSDSTAPQLARLVLNYERQKGTVRIEGTVEIRKVELSLATTTK
jgi:tetratricopeptide (TPR) repeat protein